MAAAIVASIYVGWEVADWVYQADATTWVAATPAELEAGQIGTMTVTANTGLLGGAVSSGAIGQITATTLAGIAGGAAGGAVSGGILSGNLRGALKGAEYGAIGGGVGGFLKGMIDVGTNLAETSHLTPYAIEYDPGLGGFLPAQEIDPSSIVGQQNIYVNGMMNTFSQAVGNGENFYQNSSFILEYSPTHGFFPDLAEAAVEKLTGISSEGNDLAQVLEQIDPHGSELFMHSRGALVGMDALRKVIADGVSLNGLTVSGYGGAANVLTVRSLVSSVGGQIGSWTVNAFDATPNIVGGDAILAPWRGPLSVLASPLLFMGGRVSPHSSLTASGGTFWSNFNSGL